MKRYILFSFINVSLLSSATSQTVTPSFPAVTFLYSNPYEACSALMSTNAQTAWNAYFSVVVIGKPAISQLLTQVYVTNLYCTFAHWSWCSSLNPWDIPIGTLSLYLIEAILHQHAHPHYAATLCKTNNYHADISSNDFCAVVQSYQSWWHTYSTCSLDYIRNVAINPLAGSEYMWIGYTGYMDNAVIQLPQ